MSIKKQLTQIIKIATLGILISGGIAIAAPWQGAPAGGFPNGNIHAPVNVSMNDQTKTGNLGVSTVAVNWNKFSTKGNLAVSGDIDSNIAQFGNNLHSGNNIQVLSLSQDAPENSGYAGLWNAKVCAKEDGTLVLCEAVVTNTCTSTGTQMYDIVGGVQKTSGTLGTANPNSFTVPNGCKITVKTWAAGGGGGGGCTVVAYGGTTGGGGGGAGEYREKTFPYLPNLTIPVSVGVGGAKGANNLTDCSATACTWGGGGTCGMPGTNSSFGNDGDKYQIKAIGGSFGVQPYAGYTWGGAGAGGSGGVGGNSYPGAPGDPGRYWGYPTATKDGAGAPANNGYGAGGQGGINNIRNAAGGGNGHIEISWQ